MAKVRVGVAQGSRCGIDAVSIIKALSRSVLVGAPIIDVILFLNCYKDIYVNICVHKYSIIII